MYTLPVLRSNSKFVVLKNSLSGGQLNSILPSVVSIGSLSFIRSPTLELRKSGTYQSWAMVPCCRTNSLMASSLVLCRSTMGFMARFGASCTCSGWLHFLFIVPQPWLLFERLCCSLLAFLSLGSVFLLSITNGLSSLLTVNVHFSVLIQCLFSLVVSVQLYSVVSCLYLSASWSSLLFFFF